jgi:hypothetical protein
MPGFDDFRDFAGQIRPDTWKFREVFACLKHTFDALRQTLDHPSGAPVRANAKLVLPFDFEEFGDLIEHRRNFCILNRQGQLS